MKAKMSVCLGKVDLLSIAVLAFVLLSGCADLQSGGSFGAYNSYRGGATLLGRGWQPAQCQQMTVAHSSLPSVNSARVQTGSTYEDGMAKLRQWTATQREYEIEAYLARRPEFKRKVREARAELKSALIRWDSTLAARRDLVTRIGGDLSNDFRYKQLEQGRAQTQARLDTIDASLVSAMLEDNAGAAARSMSWSDEMARKLENVAQNASNMEKASSAAADFAFQNAVF